MAQTPAYPSRHDVQASIVKRCWENDEFRREFISDPAAAFVKYLEVPRDALPSIVVHDETPGTWHIVMPASPTNPTELSDEDLERVAGGTFPTPAPLAAVAAAAAGTPASVVVAATITVSAILALTVGSAVQKKKNNGW